MRRAVTFRFVRTLRTQSSERFIIQSCDGQDAAAVDVHYLADGSVVGTLIIVDHTLLADGNTQALLQFIDESLLPMVSLDEKNLSFTVVKGEMIGQFENEK